MMPLATVALALAIWWGLGDLANAIRSLKK